MGVSARCSWHSILSFGAFDTTPGGNVIADAEEAAADAKKRATEARDWIDSWKSKQ